MTKRELVDVLEQLPDDYEILICLPDGEGFMGAPATHSFPVTDVGLVTPDDKAIRLYAD